MDTTASPTSPRNRLGSLGQFLSDSTDDSPDRSCVRWDDGTTYRTIATGEWTRLGRAMAAYLSSLPGDQEIVATICKNRPEWDMTAMGCFHTANILCPLDTRMDPTEVEHILSIRHPRHILTSRAELARVRELVGRLGLRSTILVADLFPVQEDLAFLDTTPLPGEISLRQIVSVHDGAVPEASPRLADPSTVLAHYATSGTLNLPKIVRITHGNILASVNGSLDVLNLRPSEDVLNIGPYTHIATLVEFLVTKLQRFTVTYFTREPDDDGVLEAEIAKLKRLDVRVKALMAVPKFWIHLLKEVLEEMRDKPALRELHDKIRAIEMHGKLQDLGLMEKAKLAGVRIRLRDKLGGHFSYGISSSTKIDAAIVEIFARLGITVLDIYGATECTGIIARNRLNDLHPGTSGRILEGFEWRLRDRRALPGRIEPVGILEVRGAAVAKGYLGKDGEEPLNVDPDGWLSTGDLAWVDSERRVHLVGREKEMIEWEGGWLLDPQHLSNLVVRGLALKDAMVVKAAEHDRKLSVYVFPDKYRLEKDPGWKADLAVGISPDAALATRVREAIRYAQLLAGVPAEMDQENIWILPRKLERTPTHKIKFLFERRNLHLARRLEA